MVPPDNSVAATPRGGCAAGRRSQDVNKEARMGEPPTSNESQPADTGEAKAGKGPGEIYAVFLKERLDAEEAAKTSLQQRGLAVITTAGALVTILFSVAAVVTGKDTYRAPSGGLSLLVWVAVAFGITGFLALLTNVPLGAAQVNPDDYYAKMARDICDDEATCRVKVASIQCAMLKKAVRSNNIRARLLVLSFVAEGAAVVLLAVAVRELLTGRF
jgi:hypothetical protein